MLIQPEARHEAEPKLITPRIIQPSEPEVLLQNSFDELFGKRSSLAGGQLGKLIIKSHDLTNRPSDDPTLVENMFHPADSINTNQEVDRILSRTRQKNRLIDEIDDYTERHSLKEYDKLVIICPHVVMSDVLALGALSLTGKLGEGRQASDNYFFLSRGIGYINYKYPFQDEKHNVFNEHALPLGNILQVIPDTSTTKDLREKHDKLITSYNRKALESMRIYKREQTSSEGQEITFIAPTGSRLKTEKTSAGKVLQMEPISKSTLNLLYKSYKKNIPIVPAGVSFTSIFFFMPGPIKQRFKLYLDEPIIKGEGIDPRDPVTRQHFEDKIKSTLLLCANTVHKRSVIPAP